MSKINSQPAVKTTKKGEGLKRIDPRKPIVKPDKKRGIRSTPQK